MFTHPELLLLQATERRVELELATRQARLAAPLRRLRKPADRRPDRGQAREPTRSRPQPATGAPAENRPAGSLAACAASGAPAR